MPAHPAAGNQHTGLVLLPGSGEQFLDARSALRPGFHLCFEAPAPLRVCRCG